MNSHTSVAKKEREIRVLTKHNESIESSGRRRHGGLVCRYNKTHRRRRFIVDPSELTISLSHWCHNCRAALNSVSESLCEWHQRGIYLLRIGWSLGPN